MHELHSSFMLKALIQARRAGAKGEVPIGAVLVRDNKVVASGFNLTRTKFDPTAHAEIIVIRKAISKLKNQRFLDTVLYVTLEPCAMCAGAIVQARIPLVVFGAHDIKAGACGSLFEILPNQKLNHRPTVISGVLAGESAEILSDFFKARRKEKKAYKLLNGH